MADFRSEITTEAAIATAETTAQNTDTTTFFPDSDPAINPVATSANVEDSSKLSTTDSQNVPQTTSNISKTILITLTHSPLSTSAATEFTRSPTSGANVLFLGTTRSYFQDPSRPVSRLSYSSYPALALRTLLSIAEAVQSQHGLEKIYIAHRLGEVAVAEESIIVAVSSAHRGPAWKGAEELLERVKERAEIWKREWFVDGAVEVGRDGERGVDAGRHDGAEVGVWRDNRESDNTGKRTT